jgi:YfiH family protein
MTNGLTNPKYILPDWPAPAHIKAYSTTRLNGPLGIPRHITPGQNTVKMNRELLKNELALPNEPAWLKQIHSNQVVLAETVDSQTQADASFTSQPNIVCVAMTADCLPVLLCNQSGSWVAAIHAGWRGLGGGVLENTLAQIRSQPLYKADNFMAWLGPAIGPKVFEVGDEVRQLFVQAHPEAEIAFQPQGPQKWLADIFTLAKLRLRKLGVEEIYGGNLCTFSNPEQFYSYRRDKERTGNMASLIWIDRR